MCGARPIGRVPAAPVLAAGGNVLGGGTPSSERVAPAGSGRAGWVQKAVGKAATRLAFALTSVVTDFLLHDFKPRRFGAFCSQETHVSSGKVAAEEDWCRRNHIKAKLSPAVPSPGGYLGRDRHWYLHGAGPSGPAVR